ncbi:MAG: hypothetical protein AB7R40_22515 [Nitrospiraceae bacterium]
MATIHNYEIYSETGTLPPVVVALGDLRKQALPMVAGKILRRLTKAINAQIEDIGDERKRLLEVYAKRGPDGEPVPVVAWTDLEDVGGFQRDFQEFLNDTFEVEPIPWDAVASKSLLGETWSSPIIADEPEPVAEKKEGAPASAGASSEDGAGADN